MRMKYKVSKALLLFWLFVTGLSCQRDEIAERDTLKVLSEDLIQLDTQGSSISLEVQSNRTDWGYIKNAEWLAVSKTAKGLVLSAGVNPSSQSRTAEVVVVAGYSQRKLVVEQAAQPANVVTRESHREIDYFGGTILFDITTNIPEWNITTDAEWLSVRVLRQTSQVEVAVAPHQGRSQRGAKIYIVDSQGVAGGELSISQQARPYHLLPHWGFLGKDLEIRNFEFARGSSLTLLPDGFFNHYIWRFSTVSEAFGFVNYTLVKDQYLACDVYATNRGLFSDLSELEDQRKFLRENGFEMHKENVYYNAIHQVRAKIITDDGYHRVNYAFHPTQATPQPTVPSIPDEFSSLSASLDEITAWEVSHGGTYNLSKSTIKTKESESCIHWFDVDGRDDIVARYYVIPNKTRVLNEYAVCYSEIGRVYQKYQNDLFYSDEFLELLEREGFGGPSPQGNNSYKYSFKHRQSEGSYYLITRYVKFKALSMPVAELHFVRE